ncbi:hypothetical protein PAAG_01386 [Paracoccidioides lutzii Pb01]|uniref:Uncharacterized protein n=1 Tax=Paracoccidioides lutzii (strain ATCC MYA-826 / Pb01) TaxID=502779 RepID=C1GS91_PARBA|nr:hypothetical protein PAAG_01386 [Paracoccidioides lutzii Pb01]EEH38924.2 hypothetical protein PAAG_01386 [Paracoccidioides lutzii Pb01]
MCFSSKDRDFQTPPSRPVAYYPQMGSPVYQSQYYQPAYNKRNPKRRGGSGGGGWFGGDGGGGDSGGGGGGGDGGGGGGC